MLDLAAPVAIIAVIGVGVLALVRWALREDDEDDDRWTMPGTLSSKGLLSEEHGSPVRVTPTPDGLLLRGPYRSDGGWSALHPWNAVTAEQWNSSIRLLGPFGVIVARPVDGTPMSVALDRLRPSDGGGP